MFSAWTPRDQSTFADDEWSDHNPSPINPMYNDPSPVDNWLSPVGYPDDDMLFDFSQSSLIDDRSARQEQQSLMQRWRTPVFASKSTIKANPLSRQPTHDDIVIAGEWEEKIVRRYQRKRGLQGLSLPEVKREMPPIEFDPAFADSDTEDEEEPAAFNPESLVDPPMRVRTPRHPSPISIPPSAPFVTAAPLSPLTPLSSESQQQALAASPPSPSHPPALVPASSPAPEAAIVQSADWPVVKQEAVDELLSPSRASPAVKRPFSDIEPEVETAQVVDDVVSEGEYVPSDDEEDDADPTYGAPKARRLVIGHVTPRSIANSPRRASHTGNHSRTSSNADKPARAGPGRRRRPVDDTAPSQCTYESPLNGQRCQQIFARLPEMKRHIDHFHHEQEARAVIEGRLPRDRAKLLGESWDGTLGKPTCEGCGTEFSRRDAVKRHQNEVKAKFEDGRCVWCPGTQGRKGSAKRVAAAKLAGTPIKKQRRK